MVIISKGILRNYLSNMVYKISSEQEYKQVMETIEAYLVKATKAGGFHALDKEERDSLQILSKLAESWEDDIPLMPIRQPQTLVEMIKLKMFERNLKQKELADLLEISPTRLSEVMQGKRKISLELAKKLYKKLNISPEFILESA